MSTSQRPRPVLYLLIEAGLILGLSYVTFISSTMVGRYFFWPRLVSQLLVGLVIGVWLLSKLSPWWPWPRRRQWPTTPLDLPLVVSLGVVLLAALVAVDSRLSLEKVPLIFSYAFLFWFCYEQLQIAWFRELMLKCLLITAAIVCLFSLVGLLSTYMGILQEPGWLSLNQGIAPPRRLSSLGGANHLSGYLGILIPLALAWGMATSSRTNRIGLWVLGGLMIGLVFLTQSRGGWLGTAAGLGTLIAGGWLRQATSKPGWRPKRWQMIVAAGLGILALSSAAWLVLRRSNLAKALEGRSDLWGSAVLTTADRPLLGAGPGTFGLQYLHYRKIIPISKVYSQAHSIYLHTLATLGVAGILSAGWLVIRLLQTSRQAWRRLVDPHSRWMQLGAIAGLAAFAVHGLVDAYAFEFPASFLAVLVFSVMAMWPQFDTPPLPGSTLPRAWWIKPGLAAAVMLGLLVLTARSNAGLAAFERAVAVARQSDWQATGEALEETVSRDPGYRYYVRQLGLALGQQAAQDQDSLAPAIAAFQAGVVEESFHPLDHANLAWLLWQSGQVEQALHHMQRAAALGDSAAIYPFNLGWMLEQSDQPGAARQAYAQAVGLEPAWLELSFWDEGQSEARNREDLANAVLEIWAESEGEITPLQQAALAFHLGRLDQAQRWLEQGIQTGTGKPGDLWVLAARVALARNEPQAALAALESAARHRPPQQDWLTAKVQTHLALGQTAEAVSYWQVLNFKVTGGWEQGLLAGQLAEAQEDYPAAASHYQAVASSSPPEASSYGPTIWSRPPLAADIVPFVQRPAVVETRVKACLALGELYAGQAEWEQARDAYQAALGMDPDNPEARAGLASLP